jgi:oligosaccharide repeat unit polymerase
VCSSYVIANYLQAGSLLPALDPRVAFFLHTDFPQGLRILVRMTPAVVGLSFMAFYLRRKWTDLLLMVFALMLPLTRFSRIDVFMSLVVVIVLSSYFPIVSLNRKRLLGLLAALVLFVGGLSYLGNLRLTWYGRYDMTFARAIDFKANAGPADIFAYLYLAFPLSFENLDRFVAQRPGQGSLGLGSFDWVFSGLLKLNLIIPGYVDMVGTEFDPISTGANVPTALAVFFLDFGVVGAWLPMLIYLALWLWLFWRANESPLFAVFYALMSAAFALSSFQAIMTRAVLYYQLLAVLAVFFFNRQIQRTPLSPVQVDTSRADRLVES